MQFDDNRVDTSRVDDLRDGRGGSPFGGGGGGGMGGMALAGILSMLLRGRGGKGTLLVLLLLGAFMVFGGGGLFGSSGQQAVNPGTDTSAISGASQDLEARCNTAGAIQQYPDCLLTKAFNETDEVWAQEFARRGQPYQAPRLAFFDGSVTTACGTASTEVGPFYCPGDQRIYFDLGFAQQLQQLGVSGDYANVYIMAHEFGHHLQSISGIESEVRRAQQQDRGNANEYGIAMELQADCYAGVWGRMADDRGNLTVTAQEVRDAQSAAAAVGDDRIQAGAGQRVNPESWTHGSAAQRQQWFTTGFNSGDMDRCNTFAQLG
ncbi:MAG TPA: neutral zinc metallopeptidase [Candidatus Nanopelagicales bacterium]